MMLASIRPELFGPIIIAGSPLSYWAGVHGKNPMRYSGGLARGQLADCAHQRPGGGKFDGAWLVQNFENLNPANTLVVASSTTFTPRSTPKPALSRIRALLGRSRQPQCRGDSVHRR